MSARDLTVRGSCIALGDAAVLLRGDSGCGKSDLALRLIDGGAILVSDDYVAIHAEGGRVWASPPAPIRGLIEMRGVGPIKVPYRENVALALVLDLLPSFRVARLPDSKTTQIAGIAVPLFAIAPLEPSAPAKVRMLLNALKTDGFQGELPSA